MRMITAKNVWGMTALSTGAKSGRVEIVFIVSEIMTKFLSSSQVLSHGIEEGGGFGRSEGPLSPKLARRPRGQRAPAARWRLLKRRCLFFSL